MAPNPACQFYLTDSSYALSRSGVSAFRESRDRYSAQKYKPNCRYTNIIRHKNPTLPASSTRVRACSAPVQIIDGGSVEEYGHNSIALRRTSRERAKTLGRGISYLDLRSSSNVPGKYSFNNSFLKRQGQMAVFQEVPKDDLLLSRGANPRTGAISPDKLGLAEGVSQSDFRKPNNQESQQKWLQKGDQWISMDNKPYPGRRGDVSLTQISRHQMALRTPPKLGMSSRRNLSNQTPPSMSYDTLSHGRYPTYGSRKPQGAVDQHAGRTGVNRGDDYLPISEPKSKRMPIWTSEMSPCSREDPGIEALKPPPLFVNPMKSGSHLRSFSAPTPPKLTQPHRALVKELPLLPKLEIEKVSPDVIPRASDPFHVTNTKSQHVTAKDKALPNLPVKHEERFSAAIPKHCLIEQNTPNGVPVVGNRRLSPTRECALDKELSPKAVNQHHTKVTKSSVSNPRKMDGQLHGIRNLTATPVYDNPPVWIGPSFTSSQSDCRIASRLNAGGKPGNLQTYATLKNSTAPHLPSRDATPIPDIGVAPAESTSNYARPKQEFFKPQRSVHHLYPETTTQPSVRGPCPAVDHTSPLSKGGLLTSAMQGQENRHFDHSAPLQPTVLQRPVQSQYSTFSHQQQNTENPQQSLSTFIQSLNSRIVRSRAAAEASRGPLESDESNLSPGTIDRKCSRCHHGYIRQKPELVVKDSRSPNARKLSMGSDGPQVILAPLLAKNVSSGSRVGNDELRSVQNDSSIISSQSEIGSEILFDVTACHPSAKSTFHTNCCTQCCWNGCHNGCLGHLDTNKSVEISSSEYSPTRLSKSSSNASTSSTIATTSSKSSVISATSTTGHKDDRPVMQATPVPSQTQKAIGARTNSLLGAISAAKKAIELDPLVKAREAQVGNGIKHKKTRPGSMTTSSTLSESSCPKNDTDQISATRRTTPLTGWIEMTSKTPKSCQVATTDGNMGIPGASSIAQFCELLVMPFAVASMLLRRNPQAFAIFKTFSKHYWGMIIELQATSRTVLGMAINYSKNGELIVPKGMTVSELLADCLKGVLYGMIFMATTAVMFRIIKIVMLPVTILSWLFKTLAQGT